jgi:eukaryotic-like serine/threonine-protein kinase
VTCPHCGADNPAQARFCMSCGTALSAPSVPAATGPSVPAATGEGTTGAAPAGEPGTRANPPSEPPAPRPSPLPAQFTSVRSAPSELPATHPEWKMSPAGPLPDPPKRRIWLWVLGGVGVLLLLCVVMTIVAGLAVDPSMQAPGGP